jgi:hypothetical protein
MYLFFVRHFNDIDHMTPVAWKMKKNGHSVAVFSINPRYDIFSDYRLLFLKNQGVIVDSIYQAYRSQSNWLQRFVSSLTNKCLATSAKQTPYQSETSLSTFKLPRKLNRLTGSLLFKLNRMLCFDDRWATFFLKSTGAEALCFDHISPKLYVVNALLKVAQKLAIPTFSLPHGVLLYTNENAKPKATDIRRFNKFDRYDYVLVTNNLRKVFLTRAGLSEKKIFVLGSARYCQEWLQQNRQIMPRILNSGDNTRDALKVVFMPSKPQCQVDLKRLKTTCSILASIEGIEVMIKPHTRSGGERHLMGAAQLPVVSHMLTAELCEWADVMLVVGSSVITEMIMSGKPALYLKYLHDNTTLFEEIGACWTIHDEQELKLALSSLRDHRGNVPYSEADVGNYVNEVVFGGRSKMDVLSEYEKFITRHVKRIQRPGSGGGFPEQAGN